jgi:hypothetical protein
MRRYALSENPCGIDGVEIGDSVTDVLVTLGSPVGAQPAQEFLSARIHEEDDRSRLVLMVQDGGGGLFPNADLVRVFVFSEDDGGGPNGATSFVGDVGIVNLSSSTVTPQAGLCAFLSGQTEFGAPIITGPVPVVPAPVAGLAAAPLDMQVAPASQRTRIMIAVLLGLPS